MTIHVRRRLGWIWIACLCFIGFAAPAVADEIWIAPTAQQDLGGLGVGSNAVWPATVVGAVRFAWAVPDDLQAFQSAKVVLIPHGPSPGGSATLNVYVCTAQNGSMVAAACAGPFTQGFSSVANQLTEVEIGPMVASRVGVAGANYLAVIAYSTPTTATDHIVGLRFAYTPKTPSGVASLGANTFSGTQTATAFVGDGSGLTNLPPGPPGPAGPQGVQGPPGSTGPQGPAGTLSSFDDVTGIPCTFQGYPSHLTLVYAADGTATLRCPRFEPHTIGPGSNGMSVKIGTDGFPLVSYRSAGGLTVAHCTDAACTTATTTVIVPGVNAEYNSLAIGTDGYGIVSYSDHVPFTAGTGNLKVAHCTNTACTAVTIATVETSETASARHNSIAIGTDGAGLISYFSVGLLKVAHCADVACSSSTITVIDNGGGTGNNVGQFNSLAIGTDGLGLISYHDATAADLKVAHCNDTACTSAATWVIDDGYSLPGGSGSVGAFTSLVIGTDGRGLISYWDLASMGLLRVAHCNDTACTAATNTFADNGNDGLAEVGRYSSIAIGSDGFGIMSYYDGTNGNLKVARCNDTECTAPGGIVVDAGDVWLGTAIAIGTDGRPIVIYTVGDQVKAVIYR